MNKKRNNDESESTKVRETGDFFFYEKEQNEYEREKSEF